MCITREGTPRREELVYRAGRVVSITYLTLSHWRSVLSDPDSALHAVSPFRAMSALLERDDAVRELYKLANASIQMRIRFGNRRDGVQPALFITKLKLSIR